ncbi:hypothetical protein HDU83_008552 [Entophlyctis luteolus]|nr:hypothetical protein HDU83_008552 [Entophlyctis luteolus]
MSVSVVGLGGVLLKLKARQTMLLPPPAPALAGEQDSVAGGQSPDVFSTALRVSSLCLRVVELALIFLPSLLALPIIVFVCAIRARYPSRNSPLTSGPSPQPAILLRFIELLTYSLQLAGPAFIKLAQYASSREDLFSYEICQILGRLQDRGSPHSMGWTRKVIVRELSNGVDSAFEDLFEDFDTTPIGVGAIAQVYKAKLKSTHNAVAVKVAHPNVSLKIGKDLEILRVATNVLVWMFPNTLKWLSLPDELRVFSEMMHAQTDLRVEGSNLRVFRENFSAWSISKSDGGGSVWFPEPIMATPSVMVEEYVDAVPVNRFLRVQTENFGPDQRESEFGDDDGLVAVPLDKAARLRAAAREGTSASGVGGCGTPFDVQIAKVGMRSFVKMLLVDNFTHSDLHPGNIQVSFVKADADLSNPVDNAEVYTHLPWGIATLSDLNSVDDETFITTLQKFKIAGFVPRVVFLDAGLVSTLSVRNLINLNDLLAQIVRFDGAAVAKLLVERQRAATAAVASIEPVRDFAGFSAKMSALLARIRDSSLKLSTVSFSWILRRVFEMVRTHHVRLEGDFANVGVAVMLVEGVGRRLDPGVDLLEEVRNVVVHEWSLAVGDLFVVRAVLEVYAWSKRIGQEIVETVGRLRS